MNRFRIISLFLAIALCGLLLHTATHPYTSPEETAENTYQSLSAPETVEAYAANAVDTGLLQRLCYAGMGQQVSKEHSSPYIIINDSALLQQLYQALSYENAPQGATAAIVLCTDTAKDALPQAVGAAAATQNLLDAAYAYQLMPYVLSLYTDKSLQEDFNNILQLSENQSAFSVVLLGYALKSTANEAEQDDARILFNRAGESESAVDEMDDILIEIED